MAKAQGCGLAKPVSHRMGLDYLPSLAFLDALMDVKKTTCCRYKSLPRVGSFPATLCQQQTLLSTPAKVRFEGLLLLDCLLEINSVFSLRPIWLQDFEDQFESNR